MVQPLMTLPSTLVRLSIGHSPNLSDTRRPEQAWCSFKTNPYCWRIFADQHPTSAADFSTNSCCGLVCSFFGLIDLFVYLCFVLFVYFCTHRRYKLNIWDVGGQKTLRPYWRNYFEKTDGLIWVVDSADLARLEDCKAELQSLLQEERLFGSTLLILANKQDIASALSLKQIEEVREEEEQM